MEAPNQIAIAGNIGVGKSGLCLTLAKRLKARGEIEDVTANVHFEDFYADPRRWSFASQLSFAAESVGRHVRAQDGTPVVMDRTLYEGVSVFAGLLASRGDLNPKQLALLEDIAGAVRRLPHQPDVLIYLEAPPSVLHQRIKDRARRGEENIDLAYLAGLEARYERFIADWDLCPIIAVDTVEHDLRVTLEVDELIFRISELD